MRDIDAEGLADGFHQRAVEESARMNLRLQESAHQLLMRLGHRNAADPDDLGLSVKLQRLNKPRLVTGESDADEIDALPVSALGIKEFRQPATTDAAHIRLALERTQGHGCRHSVFGPAPSGQYQRLHPSHLS